MGETNEAADGGTRGEIVLVDNDERIVELLSWFLGERGFSVRSADSFAAAETLFAERAPDLLVSDVDLGVESAVAELPRLAAAGVLPRTLVVSGFLDARVEGALRNVPQVLDSLAKPFEFTDLEAKIVACLEREPVPAAELHAATHRGADPVPDEDGWIEITGP